MKSSSSIPSSMKRFRKQPLIGGQLEIGGILTAVRAGRCCRLIGPRYHHKSQIMRAACEAIDRRWATQHHISPGCMSPATFYSSLRPI
jgi:hypothetical protein